MFSQYQPPKEFGPPSADLCGLFLTVWILWQVTEWFYTVHSRIILFWYISTTGHHLYSSGWAMTGCSNKHHAILSGLTQNFFFFFLISLILNVQMEQHLFQLIVVTQVDGSSISGLATTIATLGKREFTVMCLQLNLSTRNWNTSLLLSFRWLQQVTGCA